MGFPRVEIQLVPRRDRNRTKLVAEVLGELAKLVATGDLEALRTKANTGAEGSLEDIFLRLTEEAAAPPVEVPRRRGWFRRG